MTKKYLIDGLKKVMKPYLDEHGIADIDCFLKSSLGKVWQVLPLGSLSSSVSFPKPQSSAGRPAWFDVQQAI